MSGLAPALGLRGRLLATVLTGMGLLLAALTVAFNVVLSDRLDSDARSVVQARAAAGLGSLAVSSGRIRLPESPDERAPDAQLWVFQGGRPIEHPTTAPPPNQRAAEALATAAPATRDVPSTHTRLVALPVVQTGRRVGAVVAAISLSAYEQTRRTALVASTLLALSAFIAVAFAAAWLISKSLRPVARMTRQAAEWSELDLDRRFAMGEPRDELTELAATLDSLLDRLSVALRHEQRLSAELSHELRTPLASITANSQYALRHAELSADARAVLEHIAQSAERMGRTLETLIAAARADLDPRRHTSDAIACAHAALAAAEPLGDAGVRATLVSATPGVRVGADADVVERVLVPLLENARRHADSSVQLAVSRQAQTVTYIVTDDGPGVPSDDLESIFEPGRRGRGGALATIPAGAGLGLPLARRLARTVGGDVFAEESERGGRFVVRLPAA